MCKTLSTSREFIINGNRIGWNSKVAFPQTQSCCLRVWDIRWRKRIPEYRRAWKPSWSVMAGCKADTTVAVSTVSVKLRAFKHLLDCPTVPYERASGAVPEVSGYASISVRATTRSLPSSRQTLPYRIMEG